MVVCAHDELEPPPPNGEHPIVAVLAVVAIVLAILLISWARVEVHGTGDLEATLSEETTPPDYKTKDERDIDEAVTANRFATGLSP